MKRLEFGEIKDIEVGRVFKTRRDLSRAGIHGPTELGIWGREKEGASSIVLSGRYADDVDKGNTIIYTGHGGHDRSTNKQIANQELKRANLALSRNVTLGLPVRVTRKTPDGTYRYDGLYRVDSFWRATGKYGYEVWLFKLIRERPSEEIQGEATRTPKGPPSRRLTRTLRIVRDTEEARKVKDIHEFRCQVCGVRLPVPGGYYAEGAHIKPLGEPHNGDDSAENILCLCPNHHAQLDYGSISVADDLSLLGLEGSLQVAPNHRIDRSNLKYHREHIWNGSPR